MKGVSISGIVLTILDFSSVIQFLIGGLLYYKITKKYNINASKYALCGVISIFTGGLPNACDKFHWAFGKDTIFNSNWMFVFVGVGFSLLLCSILMITIENKKSNKTIVLNVSPILLAITLNNLNINIKYLFMLIATAAMDGYYIHTYRLAKKYIGKSALWYIVAMFMSLVLSAVSAICNDFNQYWPNILAQSFNNLVYCGYIVINKKWLNVLN